MATRLGSAGTCILFILTFTVMNSHPATSGQRPRVTAILSTEAAPYREHMERFRSRFPGKVDTLVLPSDTTELIQSLRKDPPQLILALGSRSAQFAAGLDTKAPVLFSMVYDPEMTGIKAGPGVCGISLKVPHEAVLSALEAVAPLSKPRLRVGVLHLPEQGRKEVESLKWALKSRGHTLVVHELSSPEDLPRTLNILLPRIDVLWILAEPSLIPDEDYLQLVLSQALNYKVAVVGLSDAHVRLGALVSASVDYKSEADHAYRLAMEILEGKPTDKIGIQPPQNVIWSLNMKVANEIGWEVSFMTRKRFERVYP
jgi:ABC-type uncharacterized transport system substrate-binding protein